MVVRAETARGCRPIALGCGNGGFFAEYFIDFGMYRKRMGAITVEVEEEWWNSQRMGAEHRFAR